MEQNKESGFIDLAEMLKKLLSRKKLFFIVWVITFVVASFYILCIPRYYTTSARLAPELGGSMSTGGTLGSIASSFGFDLGDMQNGDAIFPSLYPDLMEDNAFVARMFPVHVKSLDGEIDTDYKTYLCKHQKSPWWSKAMKWVKQKLPIPKKETKRGGGGGGQFNPYLLSEQDDNVANTIRANIAFSYNEKTGVVTISAKAQDPLICKTLCDTIQTYLQEYITEYRTKKSRVDVEHYEQLTKEAFAEYQQARRAYAAYSDGNRHAILQSVTSRISDLQNAMQQKYTRYTAFDTQLQLALSKVQERTPAFTTIKGADTPILPAGPKRMIFVAMMLILATVVTAAIVLRDDIRKIIVIKQ